VPVVLVAKGHCGSPGRARGARVVTFGSLNTGTKTTIMPESAELLLRSDLPRGDAPSYRRRSPHRYRRVPGVGERRGVRAAQAIPPHRQRRGQYGARGQCLRRPLRRPRSTADAAARKRGLQRDPTASAFPRLGTLGFGSHRSARAPIAGCEPDVEDLAQTIVSALGDLHSSVGPRPVDPVEAGEPIE
jgi:hypothetical protein